ncbi:hypothetical protein HPP92_007327 [Vanilla planifolia]|uniref:Uncharacterized protein n=1 Tax=Vanilla planifolia TaxID=51239 RepID=A0A835V9Z0_VANPL|nr:hypothetical protein HPP92_007327 [Vanilla planifolia]
MSRCFPYRPTNFRREDVSCIGSIKKPQNDKGIARQIDSGVKKNSQRRKRYREKEAHGRVDCLGDNGKKRIRDPNFLSSKSCPKVKKLISDNLERSGLSEEHNPPAFVLNPSSSSESTHNNGKRIGLADPEPQKKSQGLVLRFKLPLKKCNDPEPPSCSTDVCCSSQVFRSSNIQEFPSKSDLGRKEVPSSKHDQLHSAIERPGFSGRTFLDEDFTQAYSGRHSQKSEERLYWDLMSNWKPIPIYSEEANAGEEDWLFAATKQSQRGEASTQDSSSGVAEHVSCPSTASSLQPRACYLPEHDIYHLPYVVPF